MPQRPAPFSFSAPAPSWADWESREVLPWREACQEEPTEDFSLNVALAGRVIQIRMNGVKRQVRRLLAHFLTPEPPDEVLALPDAWDPEHYRENRRSSESKQACLICRVATEEGEANLRERLAAHLIAHDILPIYARTVVIHRPALDGSPAEPRALLLIGEKKHEAAFRLHQRLRPQARVLMGSVQALQITDGHLTTHATPFTDRYPWEETPAGLSCAEITRILLLPSDVTFLSSEDFDIETLFNEETSPDLLPSLIKSLVLPSGLPLRLRALSLAGKISEAFK